MDRSTKKPTLLFTMIPLKKLPERYLENLINIQSLLINCDPFFRCSDLSFFSQASSTHEEKFAPGTSAFSRSMLASISSISSWGKRIFFFADLLFVLPLVTFTPQSNECYVRTQYNKKRWDVRVDMCAHIETYCAHSIVFRYYNEQRPGVLGTLPRRLITT
jgi:hypothetical protein